jgi:hypothetical protein
MVLPAAVRTGFRIRAHPDTGIDGVDGLPVGQRVSSDEGSEGRAVHVAVGEGRIQAPSATTMRRLKAQMGWRGDGARE